MATKPLLRDNWLERARRLPIVDRLTAQTILSEHLLIGDLTTSLFTEKGRQIDDLTLSKAKTLHLANLLYNATVVRDNKPELPDNLID